jgi:energy-coupling factor transporter transmembrane protein EcfT
LSNLGNVALFKQKEEVQGYFKQRNIYPKYFGYHPKSVVCPQCVYERLIRNNSKNDGGVNMKKEINRFVYWTPRILSIIFILFLMLFSLDVFAENLSFWEIALALFMHNIPALILLVLVIVSWKHELVGAITFISAGLLYILWILSSARIALSWSLIIAGPAFLIGILFLIGWFNKKKIKNSPK